VRNRIDWKYVLRLELTDPGFDASVLSEFRARLIAGAAECLLFDTLLTWCRDRHLVKARGRQRTDSTHILAAVRALNRLEVVGETLRHALNNLAVVAPEWLRAVSPPAWRDRYARRAEDDRLPTTQAARTALTLTIGRDGWQLLAAVNHAETPRWVREVPAVAILRRVWMQNYWWDGTQLRWRDVDNIPPAARFISSPYDVDAHYARKHTTQWVGYKVHLTKTCEDDLPHLITHVETTSGPAADGAATPQTHAALQQRGLLPATHIVDTGFLDAALLVDSRVHYGVDLLGPTRLDYHWQARQEAGFDAQHFQIDWAHQHATCPAGKTSIGWTPAVDSRGNSVIKVKFSSKDCRRCDQLTRCVSGGVCAPRWDRRHHLTRHAEYAPTTDALYWLARGHLGHILIAVGLTVLRLGEWLLETAQTKTRFTPFARLMADTAAA
jgi:transposase